MTDEQLIRVAILWQASKNKSYRASVRQTLKVLVDFLQQSGLTTRVLLPEGAEIDDAFVIHRSDLTEEGFELYRKVEQPWFRAMDRGAPPSDVSMLTKALLALRKRGSI